MITANGMMVRTAVKEISTIGRATQGVRVVRLEEGDRVSSVAKVISDEENGGENAESKAPGDVSSGGSPAGEPAS
jgi:DNA gyrase subunit A